MLPYVAESAAKWAFYAVAVLGAMFVLRIGVNSYLGERSDFVRTPPSFLSQHPERTAIADLREVSFTAPNQLRLAAWYAPSRNRAAIVLAHGTNADRSSLLAETRLLAAAGFGVLALDFPGQGASGGTTMWGADERAAVRAAIDWLSARDEVDPQRIGGFGMSMGAYILTQAAVLDRRLRAVALAASPTEIVEQTRTASSRWGVLSEWPAVWALRASGMPTHEMPPREVVGMIAPRTVFILGGGLDTIVPEYMTQQLYAAAKEPKLLWILPGAHHGDYASVAPVEYANRLTDFFYRALLD